MNKTWFSLIAGAGVLCFPAVISVLVISIGYLAIKIRHALYR
jgi:hypothetical protein